VALTSGLDSAPVRLPSISLMIGFEDAAEVPEYAVNAIAVAAENRLVVNYPNVELLRPNQQASRAEVATFLCQALLGGVSPLPVEYVAGSGVQVWR
jgi:hypothetical protein